MTTYTFSEARQKLSSVLDRARKEGEVLIRRKDGTVYAIKPVKKSESPLDVEGVDLSLSAQEIVNYVREVRER